MNSIEEIKKLENELVQAELGPNPKFFEDHLADTALLDGQQLKQKVVDAHHPGNQPKFTKVEMSDFQFIDHGTAVVVTCKGHYQNSQRSIDMKFMRVWSKSNGKWQIIAGTTQVL